MKQQIRKGVFETNSSSTHAFSITTNSIEKICEDIAKRNNSDCKTDLINYESYLDKRNDSYVLYIKGIESPDGDELKNVYHVIKNWWIKLQLIGGFLYSNRHYIYEFSLKRDEFLNKYFDGDNYKMLEYFRISDRKDPKFKKIEQEFFEIEKVFEETKIVKYFKKRCIEFHKKNNIDIVDIVFSTNPLNYGWECGDESLFESLSKDNINDFCQTFEYLLNDNVYIIDEDEAYRPCYNYEISIF